MPPPDFMIAGAAKCGTTALYHYLKQHPAIFVPEQKEPHFFGRDILVHDRKVTTAEAYIALFAEAGADQLCGEASAVTLYSAMALEELLDWNPDVKCIAMIRNPVDQFMSFHNQLFQRLDEHHADPETAWRAQAARMRGEDMPRFNPYGEFLQYRDFCALGKQLQRFCDMIPAGQRHIILYDDFAANTQRAFEYTLDFLGVSLTNYDIDFTPRHTRMQRRSTFIEYLHRAQPWPIDPLRRVLKPGLNKIGISPSRLLRRLNEKPAGSTQISPEFRRELVKEFTPEIEKLERLTGRDLVHWREVEGEHRA